MGTNGQAVRRILSQSFRSLRSSIKQLWVNIQYFILIRKLPQKHLEEIINVSTRVLVIAPHPDDEVIGLSGLMLKSIESGAAVHVLFLTDGESSGADPNTELVRSKRTELREQILDSIGIASHQLYSLNLPDDRVPISDEPAYRDALNSLKQIIEEVNPSHLFVTHPVDYWPFDHVNAAMIVKNAWIAAGKSCELYYYWVWAWYNLRPSHWKQLDFNRLFKVDIELYRERKNELIDAYMEPKAPSGIPWSGKLPKAMLAPLRGRYEILERVDA